MHSAGRVGSSSLASPKMGILVHVCRVSWKQPISERDFVQRYCAQLQLCVVCYGFSLKRSRVPLCRSFSLPLFFFFHNKIPIPLFLRDLVWFIFRTHPPYFSFVYLCFQLQWNKKKKRKPRMQPRTSSLVPCFVLFFFWLPATKSHRHYHIKAKQSSSSYVLNELPSNTAAIF